MLKDIGIEWSILGHSERREIFKESDEVYEDKEGGTASIHFDRSGGGKLLALPALIPTKSPHVSFNISVL